MEGKQMKKAVLLSLIIVVLCGCGSKEPVSPFTTVNKDNSKQVTKQEKAKVELTKYNKYISFYNDFSREYNEEFPRNHLSYTEAFTDGNEGFVKPDQSDLLGLWTLLPAEVHFLSLGNELINSEPKMAIDKRASQLNDAIAKMNEIIKSLGQYIGVEDYQNDDFAKAMELNSHYQAARTNSLEAYEEFNKEIEQLAKEHEEKELADMKKNNMTIHITMYQLLNASKDLAIQISTAYNDPAQLLTQLNAESYGKAHENLVTLTKNLEKGSKNVKQLEKEGISKGSVEELINHSLETIKVSEQVNARLKNKEAFKENELANLHVALGNPEQVLHKCESILDSYNSAITRFGL